MYDLDHMLNGKLSSQHHEELIQQAKEARRARSIKPSEEKPKGASSLRAILVTIMHIVGR
jgi:hypothetical protein